MFLDTDIYSPNGTTYQITTDDLDEHIQWMADINTRITKGSNYFIEVGHNGNGNIEVTFLSYTHAQSTNSTYRMPHPMTQESYVLK